MTIRPELPLGWTWASIEEISAAQPRSITDGPFGSNLKTEHYTGSGARVVRLQNIGDGAFRSDEAFIGLEHYARLEAHSVQAGDVLIASLGDELPRACLAPDLHGPAIVKADCIRLRVHEEIDARYVMWALNSAPVRSTFADQIHGLGRPRLNLRDLRAATVPLPPAEEQRRIVAALEEHLSRLDAAMRAVDLLQLKLLAARGQVLEQEVSSAAGASVPLGEVLAAPLSNGRSVPTREGGFPVLRLTALRDGRIDLAEQKSGAWDAATAQPWLVSEGDFLVARGNGSLRLVGRGGLVGAVSTPVAYPDTLIRVRVDTERCDAEYLRLLWGSRHVRRQIERAARTTAGIYKINQKDLGAVTLVLPSVPEQQAVVRRVRAAWSELDDAQRNLYRLTRKGGALRRSLLAAAVTGGLTESLAADEPADLLVKRLHEQRAALPAARGRRGRTVPASPSPIEETE